MKLTTKWITNIKVAQVIKEVEKANRLGMRDTVRDIAKDAIRLSPKKTGHNRRSIKYEVGPGKPVAENEGEGAVYSTSGYGGFLEIGTGLFGPRKQMITPKKGKFLVWEGKGGESIFAKAVKGRPPTPYFKPALDMHTKDLPKNIEAYLE